MIYHDALKQFWEKGAREYIASKNFENRVLRIQEPFFLKMSWNATKMEL